MVTMNPDAPPVAHSPRVLRFELTARSIALVVLAVALIWLAFKLWTIVLVLVCALILVGTLNPVVARLERRRVTRGWAVLLILAGLLFAVFAVLFLTIPALVDQVDTMVKGAPHFRDEAVAWLSAHKLTRPLAGLVAEAASPDHLSHLGTGAVAYSSRALTIVGYAVTTFVLAGYLLADGQRAQSGLYAVLPRRFHVRLARIMLELEVIVGGYVRGQLITSAAIGGFVLVLSMVLGLRGALALAVFAAFTDVVPFVGGLIASAPVVVAATARGPASAVVVLVAMFVYQEFESRIVVPRIYGKVLRLSPAAVVLALLAGGTLLGVVGALIALPIAAGLMMIGRELRFEMPGDDSDQSEMRARDQEAEEAYVLLAIGADPEASSLIAGDLARETRLPQDDQT